jgi:Ser/Thr protein kinase RdoA (MazF antagonist)
MPDQLSVVRPFLEPMSEQEIRRAVKLYPAAGKFSEKISDGGRPYSATSLFRTERGDYFLKKRSAAWRSNEDILWEHRVIRHLRDFGFPTPKLHENSRGSTLTEMDGFYYELFDRAEGEDLYRGTHTWTPFDRCEHAREAGIMLGRFHRTLEDFDAAGRPPLGVPPLEPMRARFDLALNSDLAESLGSRIDKSPVLSGFFDCIDWQKEVVPLYEEFHRKFLSAGPPPAPWVTHGDWHANNLFFEEDKIVSVIDFHLTDISFRLYDLAVALDRNGILWLDILSGKKDALRYDILENLINGYRRIFPLEKGEVPQLQSLLPLHQLDLALSNIEYYSGVEKNWERAQWAYRVYLLEHARYYRTPEGERLLEFIAGM